LTDVGCSSSANWYHWSVVSFVGVLDKVRRSSVLGSGDGCAKTELDDDTEEVRVTLKVNGGVARAARVSFRFSSWATARVLK
jgi:hypothetical protein